MTALFVIPSILLVLLTGVVLYSIKLDKQLSALNELYKRLENTR